MRKIIVLIAASLLFGIAALAQKKVPTASNSSMHHPNILEAQKLVGEAMNKITAAQKANEFDKSGHAQKAKDLLEQAYSELKLSVDSTNANPGK